MKSHLISEPKTSDRYDRETDGARFYQMDLAYSDRISFLGAAPAGVLKTSDAHSTTKNAQADEYHRAPEMPMRNFLRVVFVR